MSLTPMSILTLYSNIPLDSTYNHTIDFESLTAQETYFESKVAQVLEENTDYSFIRTTEELKVQAHVDDLINVNYLSFYNKSKKYYAFITSKRFISNTCTGITFKIDVLQSFMFDYTIKESFIDREHQDRYTENDSTTNKPVFNHVAENIAVGEYKYNKQYELKDFDIGNSIKYVTWAIVIASTKLASNFTHTSINNKSTGTFVYLYPVSLTLDNGTIIDSLNVTLEGSRTPVGLISNQIELNNNVLSIEYTNYLPFKYTITKSGNVYNITMTYDSNFNYILETYTTIQTIDLKFLKVNNVNKASLTKDFKFAQTPTADNDLTLLQLKSAFDINNSPNIDLEPKCSLYPYRKVKLIYPNDEKIVNVKDYYFDKYTIEQMLDLNISNIIKHTNNFDEDSIIVTKANEITLGTNRWIEYENNNKATLKSGLYANIGFAGLSALLGIATGGAGLAIAGGATISTLSQITNEMLNRENIKQQPNEIRKATGSFIFNNLEFENLITLQIYDSYLRDNAFQYFMKYGYKCNNFKIPNLKSRYYYNFIKTINVNIESNIDNEYINEIKAIFDNGITFWHYRDSTTFKGINNYDYENVEMNLIGG